MIRAKPAKKSKKVSAAAKRNSAKKKPLAKKIKPTKKKTKKSSAAPAKKRKTAAEKPMKRPMAAPKKARAARPAAKKTVSIKSAKAKTRAARPGRAYSAGRPADTEVFERIVSHVVPEGTEIAAGEATKFDIGVQHNGTAMAAQEIPYEYGKDRAVLLVVDPRFVFTYWEVRQEALNDARRQLGGDAKLTLRFYDITDTGVPEQSHRWDVEVFDRLGNWYLRLSHPDQLLCLDIGVKNQAGHFICIARSNIMRLPPQSLAKPGPIKWMVVSPAGDKLISDIEEYTDADMALLKKILGPYFYDLLMRGRMASIAGSSVEAVFYDVSLLRGGGIGESPSGSSLWSGTRA
ncbi:MAG: DUF4912 domain-containing protein [bacterium]